MNRRARERPGSPRAAYRRPVHWSAHHSRFTAGGSPGIGLSVGSRRRLVVDIGSPQSVHQSGSSYAAHREQAALSEGFKACALPLSLLRKPRTHLGQYAQTRICTSSEDAPDRRCVGAGLAYPTVDRLSHRRLPIVEFWLDSP